MSKPKNQMTIRLQKKMKKEVRAATHTLQPTPKSDHIKAIDLLSRLPQKSIKKGETILKSFEKTTALRKVKKAKDQAAPQITHVEAGRWIKTLDKQTKNKRKVMTRHMTKKGSK